MNRTRRWITVFALALVPVSLPGVGHAEPAGSQRWAAPAPPASSPDLFPIVVGGVMGGLVLAAVLAGTLWWRRWQRWQREVRWPSATGDGRPTAADSASLEAEDRHQEASPGRISPHS